MSKRRFIQAVVARSLPQHGKLADAVAYAENLWDGLTQMGYGEQSSAQPRESRDYYDELTPRQQAQFRAFWNAFGLKKGRNGAAMRWGQMGELSDDDAKRIIEAAKKESMKQLPPGQARKEAQGWLFERRWHDHAPEPQARGQQQNHVLQRLNAELEHVKRLHQQSGNAALLTQIEKLEQAIEEAKRVHV
jgi:hypothetical protein